MRRSLPRPRLTGSSSRHLSKSTALLTWFLPLSGGLQQALAHQAADDRAGVAFWQTFSKISAGLSLTALVTPAAAEASPLLYGASALADLIVLAHSVRSVTGMLAKYDQLLQNELIDPDAFSFEHLARIGALRATATAY